SSGVQRRFSAAFSIDWRRFSSVHAICQELSTAPGATAFTRTSGPTPRARLRVKFTTAALLAAYGVELPCAINPEIEDTDTMAPLASRNAGIAAFEQRNTLSRLVCRMVSHSSSVIASKASG